jgi:hypothetical protein
MQQPKVKRPDTPLAPTPKPVVQRKAVKSKYNNGRATGVVISEKDEKAHPEDFKFLKNK